MKNIKTIFVLFLFSTIQLTYGQINLTSNFTEDDIVPNTIIIKVKPTYKKICKSTNIIDSTLEYTLNKIETKSINKIFPSSKTPKSKYNSSGQPFVDLSTIYEVKYNSRKPINQILNELNQNPIIEYAEPRITHQLLADSYIPNDSLIINQYYLNNIHAFEAWNICKGDSNIVIGITDTGTDLTHEDLSQNIFYNINDPLDGIDNDNDGYIDNYRGWDLGENDNHPQWEIDPHGVTISGIATASTDNKKGITGVGFHTKFLPVKISQIINDKLFLSKGYEGIVYAADQGCDIINCSWGDKYWHNFGQDIINYATINKNALIVAAAGNDGNESVFYPASYKNVISAANTDQNDIIHYKSNYGINIDICAPGTNIYTTDKNNTYNLTYHGTSLSTPIVSACAAIIKAYYPNLSALQIGEQLKVTADIIDTIPDNQDLSGLLGSGRVNLFRALTDTIIPSIKYSNINITDNYISTAEDTIDIIGTFTNYLAKSSSNLIATISSESPYIKILNNTINIGEINTMESFTNDQLPFKIILDSSTPNYNNILFKITYNDTNYIAIEYFSFQANQTYINIDTNNISTSITNTGLIGFTNFPYPRYGKGFNYKENNLIFYSNLLIGKSPSQVLSSYYPENDYYTTIKPKRIIPSVISDYDITLKMNDSISLNPINLDITQNAYAWNNKKDENYIIFEYNFINKNNYTINDLYTGLYIDWDIYLENYINNTNRINFDTIKHLSYTYITPYDLHTGIKLLSSTPALHYAIDAIEGGNEGIDILDGFSTNEKYLALTTNRHNAGKNELGNNVIDILSTGPLTIEPEDTIRVAFALIASDNIYSLHESANAAQEKYDSLYYIPEDTIDTTNILINKVLNNFSFKVYPNPVNDELFIEINLINADEIELTIKNIFGEIIDHLINDSLPIGKHKFYYNISNLANGSYLIELKTTKINKSEKIIVFK